MLILRLSYRSYGRYGLIALVLAGIFPTPRSFSQSTVSSGSIQGTVTDSTGTIIAGAKITIRSLDTGQVVTLNTTSAGTYSSGPLLPGRYLVRIESKGFRTMELSVVTQVGETTSGNVKLLVGQATQVVEVHDSAIRVNTEQSTIQGVVTRDQIETLPLNGRNFVDLAQLEPGIQIQDVTQTAVRLGHAGISVEGRYSESTVVQVDGLDMSDGTGGSFANLSVSSIQEFGISQAAMDMSSGTTNTGAVNIDTRSGTKVSRSFFANRDATLSNRTLTAAQIDLIRR
jgi:hypothetical protein